MIGIGTLVALGLSLGGGHHQQAAVQVAPSVAPVEVVTVDAQCATLNIDFSGWPQGTTARVNIGNNPPGRTPDVSNGWAINWDTRFASPEGGYAFHVEVENSDFVLLRTIDGHSSNDCPAADTYVSA